MTKPCVFVVGAGVGAWFVVLTELLAARYAGHHFMTVVQKEQP